MSYLTLTLNLHLMTYVLFQRASIDHKETIF